MPQTVTAKPRVRVKATSFRNQFVTNGDLTTGQLSGALRQSGEFHRRPLAGQIGKAELPRAVTALPDEQIEAAAVSIGPGLPGFNLGRV
jgi:hypothetical protein